MNNNSIWFPLILGAIICFALMSLFTEPEIITETETEYIYGDTTEIINLRFSLDSIKYLFNSHRDSIKKIKPIFVNGNTRIDTLFDTVYLPVHWAHFNLGSDSLGTSGKVTHIQSNFIFDEIKYRYPEKIKVVVDTVKEMKTVTLEEPFYKDNWFYSTVGLILLILKGIL